MKKHLSENGFTLTEMIIVLVIIGLLAAVAVPIFRDIMNDARAQADNANAAAVETAVDTYQVREGSLPVVKADSGTNAAYQEVVKLLKTSNYLRNKADQGTTARQKNKEFVYDSNSGTVSLSDAKKPSEKTSE